MAEKTTDEKPSDVSPEPAKTKDKDGKSRKPDLKLSPPSIQMFVAWMIIIFSIPLGLFFFHSQEEAELLKTSDFEAALLEKRIRSVVVRYEPTSGSREIAGEYQLKDSAVIKKYKVSVTYSDALDQMIRENCNDRQTVNASSFLSNLALSVVPIVLLVIIVYVLFARQIKTAGKSALQFGKSRAKLNQSSDKVTFEHVAGIEEAKEEIEEIVEYLKNPEKFHTLGGKIPKGVLMVGPPGTGKTLLARAIAGEADVPFFNISGSDFVEMFVGVGASRVRDMFEQGKRHAPCIVFIDEIDAVGRSRFSGIGGGHDEREQTLNALLVEMDGFEGNTGVIVVAATNRPDVLDPALLRPGRFDRQITIDLPDVKGRFGILQVHAKKVKVSDSVDFHVVARGTPGFSGADLANLINEAALLAARIGKNAVDMNDLEEARDKVCWGKERRSRKINDHDREVIAYHEAGHALVRLYCKHADPLHKITIIPRGTSYLGAVMHLPVNDKYTQTRAEYLDELTVLLGGRYAEKTVFTEVTSGAAMDIKQATDIARKMVCVWGMSDTVGFLNYDGREEHIYLGRDITRRDDYSEVTAREIDLEVKKIIDLAAARAEMILSEHKDQLMRLGSALLERETMDADDIRTLLGMPPETGEDNRPPRISPKAPATPEPSAVPLSAIAFSLTPALSS